MLNLYLYKNHFDELFQENQNIANWQIICPSPQRSDLYRDYLIRKGHAKNTETITVAKFLSDHINLTDEQTKLSKSELMVDLWTFWKSAVNDDYEKFHFCFELFTEVRSFDLSGSLIEELSQLATLEKDCISGLMRFHTYLETFHIVDEQKSYQLVSESFRPQENVGYIFIGFDHLNANQIDMLKGMGKKANVFVPFEKSVFNQCDSKIFWPNWIELEQTKEVEDLEGISCDYISIPSGRSAEYLSDLISGEKQILSFSNGLDLTQVNSILLSQKRFKTDFALFFTSVDQLTSKVQEQLNLNKGHLRAEDLITFLDKLALSHMNEKGFMLFKTILAFKKEVISFSEKATVNENIYNADLKLLKEVLGLNLPRTSVVNISMTDTGTIGTRDNLLTFENADEQYLYISKDDLGALSSSQRFSNDVLVIFSAFGPLQSKNLDIVILRNQLRRFINSGGNLILEEGLTHGSSIAENLFEGVELSPGHMEGSKRKNFKTIYGQKAFIPEKLSPSFIQTYIDCPKKWHLKYAQGVDLDVSSSAFIDRRYIGTINHSVIESYLELHSHYDRGVLKELISNTFKRFIDEKSLLPEKIDIESLKLSVESYCSGIIYKLLEIKNEANVEFFFERDISKVNESYKGSIDLVIKDGSDYYIYDFKTSGGAVPSKTDINEFRKIQLLAYFEAWGVEHHLKGGGYLCLENLKDSIFIGEEKFFNEFHSRTNRIENYKKEEFNEFMSETMVSMREAESWPATPQSSSICTFCVANPICAKGGDQ
ncbi:PD-(D/E)XK nuclease family protein [Halobacteriovorax sp. ZH5_bin.2]|uniref:PD-(D/E)XK nuclease family protein n=1 Tax=unclassified Halobacteriovorax TaxID=2639665 RepID=UPI00371D78EA